MSLLVVDASVGIKWVVPEIHSDAALQLQNPVHDLHVPAFFDVELGNILWKKVRRKELTEVETAKALLTVLAAPVKRHPDNSLVVAALDLANKTECSVYDCMYLALASRLGGKLVTADERFVNSLAGTSWASLVLLIPSDALPTN